MANFVYGGKRGPTVDSVEGPGAAGDVPEKEVEEEEVVVVVCCGGGQY